MSIRPATQFVLDRLKDKPLKVVEVGVREGKNAMQMLKTLTIETLYLVDNYEAYQDGFKHMTSQEFQDMWYRNMFYYMEDHTDKVVLITKPSLFAVTLFNDESLDYVYLDANHSFDSVRADIWAWANKIKPGGVLGGHDYGHPYYPGVKEAVKEFCRNTKRELVVQNPNDNVCDDDKLDWAIII